MHIGIGIVAVREKKGISQLELVARTKLTQTAMSRIENGNANPTDETLQKIATALDTDIEFLKLASFFPDKELSGSSRKLFNEAFPDFREKLMSFIKE